MLSKCLVGLVVGGTMGCATKPIALKPTPFQEVAVDPPRTSAPLLHQETWMVRTLRGHVEFKTDAGQHPPAAVGSHLFAGTSIETGLDGMMDLYLVDMGVLRIMPESTVRLDEFAMDETGVTAVVRMSLQRGRMMGNARYFGRGSTYVLSFPGGHSSIDGGQFEVNEKGPIQTSEARLYFNVSEAGPVSVEVRKEAPSVHPRQEYILTKLLTTQAGGRDVF